MHSVDVDKFDRFAQEYSGSPADPDAGPVSVTLATWKRIQFCPWCGKRLERYYRKCFMQLADEELSIEHGWSVEPQRAAGAASHSDGRDE